MTTPRTRHRRPAPHFLAALILAACADVGAAEPEPKAPVPVAQAAASIRLPQGFNATLFAGEPDVLQPIGFDIDAKGRLWVAECFSYPAWRGGPKGKDRIVIYEDTDGDGRHDSRKVFWEGATNLTSVALGFGGVWITAAPELLFIPDKNADDQPDGPPVVKLDGWAGEKAQHNFVNGLSWAPDGWLWGMNGILSLSNVGKPGASDDQRTAVSSAVWRYHPTRDVFEVVTRGTTNPWGLDFDDLGEAFITNCVTPHVYRAIPGARFQRMFGDDENAHSYGLMTTCADHIHWAGGNWTDSRGGTGKHGEAGGGHAHVGAMLYLGDNWPDSYRNNVYTCNLHGKRVNRDTLERKGSGYVARHDKDFLTVDDPWFRGIELAYGPDGGVFMLDWSDTGECHETDADGSHRENGRIFKISYGQTKPFKGNLNDLPDAALVGLQAHRNDWFVRQSRRILQERAAAGLPMAAVHESLRTLLNAQPEAPQKLRALWALHATGGADEPLLQGLLAHESEYVRGWAIRLLVDAGAPSPSSLARFVAMAAGDPSAWVRLALASAAQRIPIGDRWAVVEPLVARAEDAADADLPLMIWYAVEPLVPSDRARAASLLPRIKIPVVRQYLTRRLVADQAEAGLAAVLPLLIPAEGELRRPLLEGLHEALRPRKAVPLPASWPAAAAALASDPSTAVRDLALVLSLKFNAPDADKSLRTLMADPKAEVPRRIAALTALVEARPAGLAPDLQALLADSALRPSALRALAAFDDPGTAKAILARYPDLSPAERNDAVSTLATRPDYALALVDALEDGIVPRRDVTATTARQLLTLGDKRIADRLEQAWGTLRATSGEKASLIARYQSILTPVRLETSSAARGRVAFDRLCASCHTLFDAGADVGPDLTGSDRTRAEYILENVLDPSASVARDYRVTTLSTVDGRVLSGLVRDRTPEGLVLRTANDRLVIPVQDIEAEKQTNESMMPEGLLDKLTDRELLDLFAYLGSRQQVPKP
jgi:putative membrane-bound dehydrogenase-like protein